MAFLGPVDFPALATGLVTLPQGIIGAVEGTIGAVQSSLGTVTGIFSKLKLLSFFSLFVVLGKCIIAFFNMIWKTFSWILIKFIPWLIYNPWPPTVFDTGRRYDKYQPAAFLPWAIRYMVVLSSKIANFPKCFVWYIIDIVVWTLYLPFRFVFWLIDYLLNIGFVKGEHKVWNFLNDIDYYVHGPVRNYFLDQYVTMYMDDKIYKEGEILPNKRGRIGHKNKTTGAFIPGVKFENFTYTDINNKKKIIDIEKEQDINKKNGDKNITYDANSLNLGFHIFHFPNSVMETCYSATGFKLADLEPFPTKDFMAFMKCLRSPF